MTTSRHGSVGAENGDQPAGRAAGALRRLRTVRGLSQAELARAAQVSERTVRGIESGRIEHPHRASLVAIAGALGLPQRQQLLFVRSWGPAAIAKTLAQVGSFAVDLEAVLASKRRVESGFSFAAALFRARIGDDRRFCSVEEHRIVHAHRDGVERLWTLWCHERGQDLSKVRMTDLAGARVVRRVLVEEDQVLATELQLDARLRKGDSHVVNFRYDFTDAYPSAAAAARSTDYYVGFRRPPAVVGLTVVFAGARPRWVCESTGPDLAGVRRSGAVAVAADGTVTRSFQHPSASIVGLEWGWDPPAPG